MAELSEHWLDEAYCANNKIDPDRFTMQRYESHQSPRIVELVAKTCGRCIVRKECLLDAVETRDKDSVRGGLTPGQRKNILRFPSGDSRRENS